VRLVLAHSGDEAARRLTLRWGGDAVLATPADLHRHVWRLAVDATGATTVSLDGGVRVNAVVTRLAGVSEEELGHVHRDDRPYAAAELTAFLLAWLDACSCPVVNRPAAGCLNGPPWGDAHWAAAAARVGLTVRPAPLTVRADGPTAPPRLPADVDPVCVTVVGDMCLGGVSADIASGLRALAHLAGTPLLGVTLDGTSATAAVVSVTPWPDVGDPVVADALADVLAGG
jgi:hypothetical protein